MAGAFRRRPSKRREPGPTAKQLVTGYSPSEILHHGRRAALLPLLAGHKPLRFAPGRTLAVREMNTSPVACHVEITDVRSPFEPELFTLGQVDYGIVRELGHIHLAAFRHAWLLNHDQDWVADRFAAGELTEEAEAGRFEIAWNEAPSWLLRFEVVTQVVEKPRLLSSQGYTSSLSLAIPEEPEALTEEQYEKHVAPRRGMANGQWLALAEAVNDRARQDLLLAERLERVERDANRRGVDVTGDMWRIRKRMATVSSTSLEKSISAVEQRVYRVAA